MELRGREGVMRKNMGFGGGSDMGIGRWMVSEDGDGGSQGWEEDKGGEERK